MVPRDYLRTRSRETGTHRVQRFNFRGMLGDDDKSFRVDRPTSAMNIPRNSDVNGVALMFAGILGKEREGGEIRGIPE
jgi:hypothetical protein